jgi:hypothetical protein
MKKIIVLTFMVMVYLSSKGQNGMFMPKTWPIYLIPPEDGKGTYFASFVQTMQSPSEMDRVDTFKINVPYGYLENEGLKLSDQLYFWFSERRASYESGPDNIFQYVNGKQFNCLTKTSENPFPTELKLVFTYKPKKDSLILLIRKGEKEEIDL